MSTPLHPPLALLLIDALRHDYVTPQSAPFLYRLMQEGKSGPLIPTYGFQEHPGFLTGCLPNATTIGHTMFVRNPGASPFQADRPTYRRATLARHPHLESVLRPLWDRKTRLIENERGHSASACYGMTARIPPALLPQFAFGWERDSQEQNALGVPSVYDLLRERDKTWLALGHPRDDQQTDRLLAQFEAAVMPEHALVYLHFGALDWLGHEHGPGSRQVLSALRGIDHAVERVLATLDEMHGSAAALIFGDHGMVAVERTVDVQAALAQTGLSVPDDYVFFLDSTGVSTLAGTRTGRVSAASDTRAVSKGSAQFKRVNAKNLASPMPILHPMAVSCTLPSGGCSFALISSRLRQSKACTDTCPM